LTSLQGKLFKTGGTSSGALGTSILQLAESHLTRCFVEQILTGIERLAWHPT
jgi:hypothetical protein